MIRTTTGKAIAALRALGEIRGQQIERQKAKDLFDLRKKLEAANEFFSEQLAELLEKYGTEMKPNGQIEFEDRAQRDLFLEEVAEIEGTETEIDAKKIDLSGEDIRISDDFVEATAEFIIL